MSIRDLAAVDANLVARVRQILTDAEVPGAAISVVHGGRDYLMLHGVKRADSNEPITPRTAFDLGSCSKSFVSAAIGLLVDEGRISFDDPVRHHLPEMEFDDPWVTANITIRDLLSNRTGLARTRPIEAFPNPDIDVLTVLRRVRHLPRARPFRGGYIYFNIGFMACRVIVERVTGLAYPDFMAQRLFGPLGMVDSASGSRAYEILGNRATGHTNQEGRAMPLEEQSFDNTQGAGCLYSSGTDALAWLRLHLAEAQGSAALLKPNTLRELHRPHTIIPIDEAGLMERPPEAQFAAYCLGWRTSHLGGRRIVQHSGGMFGWHVQESLIPDADLGVMVMLNLYSDAHLTIAYLIQETLLGLPLRDWVKISADAAKSSRERVIDAVAKSRPVPADGLFRPLADFTGRYFHPAAGIVEIEVSGDRLLMQQVDGRLWDAWLAPLGGDVFETGFVVPAIRDYAPAPSRARFTVDGDRIAAFENTPVRYTRQ